MRRVILRAATFDVALQCIAAPLLPRISVCFLFLSIQLPSPLTFKSSHALELPSYATTIPGIKGVNNIINRQWGRALLLGRKPIHDRLSRRS